MSLPGFLDPPHVSLLILAAVSSLALAIAAFGRRGVPGAGSLGAMMVAGAVWGVAYALELASADPTARAFWGEAKYAGIVAIPYTWLVFALRFSGRDGWLSRRWLVLLSFVPLLTLVLVFTNDAHHLMRAYAEPVGSGQAPEVAHGPWFWVHAAYSYLLLGVGTAVLLSTLRGYTGLYRGQYAAVAVGALVPWASNVLYVLEVGLFGDLDPTPIFFVFTGAAFLLGLRRYEFLDLIPVAREAVVEEMQDGFIIADRHGRIVDLNRTASRALGISVSGAHGVELANILPEIPLEAQMGRGGGAQGRHEERTTEFGVGAGERERFYEVSVSPFGGKGAASGSVVILLRDVTGRKRAETALKQSEVRFRSAFDNASTGVALVGLDNRYLRVNRALCEMLGYSGEELSGKSSFELTHPEDLERGRERTRMMLAGSGSETMRLEKRYVRKGGEVVWAISDVSLVRDSEGHPSHFVSQFQDITERKRAEEALRQSEGRFKQLFERSVEAMMIHDEEGRYADCNTQTEKLLGYSREELLSMTVKDLSRNYLTEKQRARKEAEGGTLWKRAMEGEPGVFATTFEDEVRRKDGTTVPVEVSLGPIAYGGRRMLVVSARDITERKHVEASLKDSEERLRQLFEQSADAILLHDEEGRVVECNEEACRSLGYSREELLEMSVRDFALGLLSEEERRSRGSDTLWQRAGVGEPGEVVGHHRGAHRRKDGTTFPVEVAVGSLDYAGRKLILASCRDVTAREQAEEALRESEERFRTAFEDAPIGVSLVGLDGSRLRVNRALCEMLGYSKEELLGRNYLDDVHPDDRPISAERARQTLEEGLENFVLERRYVRADGRAVWNLTSVSLIRDVRGEPSHCVCLHQDVSDRKKLEEELAHRASHDHLTGLPNRALFMDRLSHALARAGREHAPVAVLFMDLDGFKEVNDSLGHAAGDELLRQASARLVGALRTGDTLARFGGDEFAAVLEDCGRIEAERAVERIEEALSQPFAVEGARASIGVSVGTAVEGAERGVSGSGTEDPAVRAGQLLLEADRAMYRAKDAGSRRGR